MIWSSSSILCRSRSASSNFRRSVDWPWSRGAGAPALPACPHGDGERAEDLEPVVEVEVLLREAPLPGLARLGLHDPVVLDAIDEDELGALVHQVVDPGLPRERPRPERAGHEAQVPEQDLDPAVQ